MDDPLTRDSDSRSDGASRLLLLEAMTSQGMANVADQERRMKTAGQVDEEMNLPCAAFPDLEQSAAAPGK